MKLLFRCVALNAEAMLRELAAEMLPGVVNFRYARFGFCGALPAGM